MRAIDLLNGLGITAALLVPTLFVLTDRDEGSAPAPLTSALLDDPIPLVDGPAGPSLVDARGEVVPVGDYRRVVYASATAARIAIEVSEPTRIAGVSSWAADSELWGYRFAGIPSVPGGADLEAILALRPDLLVVHAVGFPSWADRLKERGIPIFDLGQMTGAVSYIEDVRLLATLLDVGPRGDDYARSYWERLHSVASDIPEDQRTAGMYVGTIAGQLYGGARDTSFHDILRFAGLADVAADAYEGWPQYNRVDLLALDPRYIITAEGRARELCTMTELDALRACDPAAPGVIELPEALISDSGHGILHAAERVRIAVYGRRSEQ